VFHAYGHNWALWQSYREGSGQQNQSDAEQRLVHERKFDDEGIKYFFSEAAQDDVFTCLLTRLTQFESPSAGFQFTAKYAAHFRPKMYCVLYLEDHSSFTACRIELLLVAPPFVLRDLLAPELALLEQAICNGRVTTLDSETPELPEDPCPDMIKALACFIDWYMPARKLWFPVDMAPELHDFEHCPCLLIVVCRGYTSENRYAHTVRVFSGS
jgi:hypothetical protein